MHFSHLILQLASGHGVKTVKINVHMAFFGHGCRSVCSCKQQQICDAEKGCQDLGVLSKS